MRAIQAIGQEDQEERVQRQALENQLRQMTSGTNAAIPEAIQAVEQKKLEELHDDAQPEKGGSEALERLRGRRDSFAPRDETLNTSEEQAEDRSIEGLKRSIESMERRFQDTRIPEEAESLSRQLESVRAQLRAKGSDAYRRQSARYSALFSEGRRAAAQG